MSQKKVQVVKAASLANVFSAKPTSGIIVQYTPKDYTFAPVKPRIIVGEYGFSVQLVQYTQNGWRQIGARLHNADYIIAAATGLAKMLATAAQMGYASEEVLPTETLQAVKGYLQDALVEIEKAIEKRKSS